MNLNKKCVLVIDFLLIIFSLTAHIFEENILSKNFFFYDLEITKEWTWKEHLQIVLTYVSFTSLLVFTISGFSSK